MLTTGTKHDGGKPPWDLLQWRALNELVKILDLGAHRYAPGNWRLVKPLKRRYIAACFRHIYLWLIGERHDPDTGLHHLVHAACSLLFIAEVELEEDAGDVVSPLEPPGEDDDRWKKE